MIQGIDENFCATKGAQGVAQGADLGGSKGAKYSSEFCGFWWPYLLVFIHS